MKSKNTFRNIMIFSWRIKFISIPYLQKIEGNLLKKYKKGILYGKKSSYWTLVNVG